MKLEVDPKRRIIEIAQQLAEGKQPVLDVPNHVDPPPELEGDPIRIFAHYSEKRPDPWGQQSSTEVTEE